LQLEKVRRVGENHGVGLNLRREFAMSKRRLSAVVLLGVFGSVVAGAQAPAGKVEPSPVLAGIAHVALRVHDLAASEAFYESLGL
jgi:catechol-2,3-dioxygenase